MTNITEDKDWLKWKDIASAIYDDTLYRSKTVLSIVNNAGHRAVESLINNRMQYDYILEVGAGTGVHLDFVKHKYKEYYITDISADMLTLAKKKHGDRSDIKYDLQDATSLDYPDGFFDRLISIYNLEHLPFPHQVLKEWSRVVKHGGIISISIPLDGGVAWRLGRFLTTRRTFKKLGLDLDYIIAREHINTGYNLISIINHLFPQNKCRYYPFFIPLTDINLIYSCLLYNKYSFKVEKGS